MMKNIYEAMDTVCLMVILLGIVWGFANYFSLDYRLCYVTQRTEIFFDEAERIQRLTKEEYEGFVNDLRLVDSDYEISLRIYREGERCEETEVRRELESTGKWTLYTGDVLTFYLYRKSEPCAVMQRILWW